ncbi:uncharacterized protein LOC135170198 [Diachasmimorpha longicaudata]|uniref:uncharacterized protein LOC135170198 n=1 Tax=Diachasmimorpha longicaudata TaxID=58733 RepID=UPI0030B886E6
MENFWKILLFIGWFRFSVSEEQCMVSVYYFPIGVEYTCVGLSTLNHKIDHAYKNTTAITIQDSDLMVISGYPFSTFYTTLTSLDIHNSRIRSIEATALWGLVYLQKLSLWGNNLTWIPGDWFTHLTHLRTLDVSFNNIYAIDYNVYYKLPNLNILNIANNKLKTIEYNLMPLMTQLRKIEFGNNPLDWSYRILLTWQLDNQRVDYKDKWNDWDWLSSAIQECQNSGYPPVPDTKLLYCGFEKLLEFLGKNWPSSLNSSSIWLNPGHPPFQACSRLKQCLRSMTTVDGSSLSLKLLSTLSQELRRTENPLYTFQGS